MNFEDLLVEKSKDYGVAEVFKEDMGGDNGGAGTGAGTGQSLDSEMPTEDPAMKGTSTPDNEEQKPEITKPYRKLGSLLFTALDLNPEQVPPEIGDVKAMFNPEAIVSDSDGMGAFSNFEGISNKLEGARSQTFEDVIREAGEMVGGGEPVAGTGGEMAEPSMDAMPTPEQGAAVAQPMYDRSYKELGKMLCEAVALVFEELPETQQRMMLAIHPDDVKSDEQGMEVFEIFEKILREVRPQETADEVVAQQDSFGPAAS